VMRLPRAELTAARLRAAFMAAALSWAALLVAAPFLASRAHASALASALIVAVYGIGSLICHQLPERSYHLWAAQMPVQQLLREYLKQQPKFYDPVQRRHRQIVLQHRKRSIDLGRVLGDVLIDARLHDAREECISAHLLYSLARFR